MSQPSPIALVLPSRPILTTPQVLSPTQYAFNFPSTPSFTHITIFLLPGITLPPSTLAAVYIQFPSSLDFKFLGAIGNEKQSAIFRINSGRVVDEANGDAGEDDMTDDDQPPQPNGTPSGDITLGISIEPAASVLAQLASLKYAQTTSSPSTALVLSPRSPQPTTAIPSKVLAQRIIKNAFNFLASFAGMTGPGGEEVVPLRSFRAWWEKFERRVEADPGFLEREVDG